MERYTRHRAMQSAYARLGDGASARAHADAIALGFGGTVLPLGYDSAYRARHLVPPNERDFTDDAAYKASLHRYATNAQDPDWMRRMLHHQIEDASAARTADRARFRRERHNAYVQGVMQKRRDAQGGA
jgi:hypothetical protein